MRFQRAYTPEQVAVDLGTVEEHIEVGGLLCLTGPDEPCPICRCHFGRHRVVAAESTEPRLAPLRHVGVRCVTCDVRCGSW